MTAERTSIDTLVVGAGQAGVAMSEHLSKLGVPHLVLERDRIAERWRTGRWDSLVANGPAWHDRFPVSNSKSSTPMRFASQRSGCGLFRRLCEEVQRADPHRRGSKEGRAQCRAAGLHRRNVGGHDRGQSRGGRDRTFPAPGDSADRAEGRGHLTQIHSADYRNPDQLPEGAVLVVGAGSSGVQIADELQRAGQAASICRLARTTVRRAPIATATSAGGWACSANGTRRSRGRAGACHHCGERCAWRPYGRLPASCPSGHHARWPDEVVRRRRRDVRTGPCIETCARRRELSVVARCSRRVCRHAMAWTFRKIPQARDHSFRSRMRDPSAFSNSIWRRPA